MANTVELDSRERGKVVWYMDYGTLDVLTWEGIPTLDSGYTVILDEGETTEVTFTVGSGITLDSQNNNISLAIDSSTLQNKNYQGYIVSDSKIVGVYFRNFIEITFQ